MPQLDASVYAGQIFWLFISFVLLFLLMRGLIVPRLQGIFFHRETYIETLLEKAKALQQQTEILLEKDEQSLQQARAHAEKKILETVESLRRLKDSEKITAEASFQQTVADLEKKLQQERLLIFAEAETACERLALAIKEKILQDKKLPLSIHEKKIDNE